MTDLYKNKYRIPSARLQTWDYASNALYFVTICVDNKECLFGQIVETQSIASNTTNARLPEQTMQLSDLGKVVESEWLNTANLRPDMNLELLEYVVMPNHFHGIIYLGENVYNEPAFRLMSHDEGVSHDGDATHYVSTITPDTGKNRFGPQYKNLASIIRGFKAAVTTCARKNDIPFNWQTRFHDHIIRSNDEYTKIANYINDNPLNWNADKFYF